MEDKRILESWKEIALHLKHSVKTCRHWAQEHGLPVHRLEDSPRARVFAYAEEVDRWMEDILNSKEIKVNRHRIALYGGAIVLLALIIYEGFSLFTKREEVIDSIAILPFENVSADPDTDYLCDGITETIINKLSQLSKLKTVISRNSVFSYKGKTVDPKKVGQELGVKAVLLTRLVRAGEKLAISPTLVRTKDNSQLWGEKYNRKFDDIFAMEEEMATSIVQALRLKLTPTEKQRILERPVDNIRAYDWYLRAKQEFDRFTEEALDRALFYFQNGLDIVGDNALLYSGIASVYWQYVNIGVKQEDYIEKAEEYIKKAFALDPDCPKAHAILGHILSQGRGNQKESVRHFKKALAMNPDDPDALLRLLVTYTEYVGKISAAFPLYERLIQISPLFSGRYLYQGILYFYDGKFSHALELYQKAYQMNPEDPATRCLYALSLLYNKQFDEAFSIIDQSAKTSPNNSYTKYGLLLKYAWQKDKEKALQEMTPEFQKTCRRDGAWSHSVGVALALLGTKKEALDWLENAVNRGFLNYPMLAGKDPFLADIRGEERFIKLMERVKKEWEEFEI